MIRLALCFLAVLLFLFESLWGFKKIVEKTVLGSFFNEKLKSVGVFGFEKVPPFIYFLVCSPMDLFIKFFKEGDVF